MQHTMRFRSIVGWLALLAVVAASAVTVAACGDASDGASSGRRGSSTTASVEGKRVIFLSLTDQCPYCADVNRAVRAGLEARGVDVSIKTTDYDPAEQAQQANQAISQRPDAILIYPADTQAAVATVQRIRQAGIPVTVMNSELTNDAAQEAISAYTGVSEEIMGARAAEAMVQQLEARREPLSGQIGVIAGVPGSAPADVRLAAFQEELGRIAPDLRVSVVQNTKAWDQPSADGPASAILSRIPRSELRGVYGEYDVFLTALTAAAKRAGIDPASYVSVGTVCTPDGKRGILEGTQTATVLQQPVQDGDYAVDALLKVLSGEPVDPKNRYLPGQIVTRANAARLCP